MFKTIVYRLEIHHRFLETIFGFFSEWKTWSPSVGTPAF
ncbi:hypothetical protein LEP1GSC188_3969 [Leptospira weilii serovar Topaz str. LT2116]|uniref:Uncharacterized protein n=1 Tax=Leptospira weilii serovar Topaz str. LT2116 TaxID=1088540 RepID=M3EI37_9LEPT|nr:hypothetical protein LEP1GSC188_3969 [Leptospira weilii serovar Topaz str. LT2116]